MTAALTHPIAEVQISSADEQALIDAYDAGFEITTSQDKNPYATGTALAAMWGLGKEHAICERLLP